MKIKLDSDNFAQAKIKLDNGAQASLGVRGHRTPPPPKRRQLGTATVILLLLI